MLAADPRLLLLAVAAAAAGSAPTPPLTPAPATLSAISTAPGRTTTVVATEDVGAPLERPFPSAAYARAAAADAEGRWDDAKVLYRQAANEWKTVAATRPSKALDNVIAKAEHEMQASQALASNPHRTDLSLGHLPEDARRAFLRRQALDEARLYRLKLMTTRAALGRLPPELYARTRARLEEARDAGIRAGGGEAGGRDLEVEMLLCATYAVGGEATAARDARATLTEAERADPANAIAIAVCAAALGKNDAALAALESFVLRPTLPRPDYALRDIYLSNDWDHLRGDPRFESLFR